MVKEVFTEEFEFKLNFEEWQRNFHKQKNLFQNFFRELGWVLKVSLNIGKHVLMI